MALRDWQSFEVTDFNGPWPRLEPTDVPPTGSLLSNNSEYNPGQVGTRVGFGLVWNPAEAISSIYNWITVPDLISAAGNYLFYYSKTSSKVRYAPNLSSPSGIDAFSATAEGAIFTSGGTRLYVATFNAAGSGANQLRVVGVYFAAMNTDRAFLGPLTTKPVLANSGTAGTITAGEHRVGYIITTRNGYTGKVSPVTADLVFDITSSFTAPGSQKLLFQLTALWPAEAFTISVVMTPQSNPNRYFIVPQSSLGVPPGISSTVNISIDITDDDLIATGVEVTMNTTLLTQALDGTGPFNPFNVVEYGQRMVYLTDSGSNPRFYASEPDNHQFITADQHVKYLPGFRKITAAFVLRNVLYVLGPHWTYAFQDTNVVPAQWPEPQAIDSLIGTLSVRGVVANSSGGFAWICDVNGLFLFAGGQYVTRPISYYVEPDWKRINWAAPTEVEIVDNRDKQQVLIRAPLNANSVVDVLGTALTWVSGDVFSTAWTAGTAIVVDGVSKAIASVASSTSLTLSTSATTASGVTATVSPAYATHICMFDYSGGLTAETVKYSPWNIDGYQPGAMGLVQNNTSKLIELWLARGVAGKMLRQMNPQSDALPYNDDTAAIPWDFELALMPGMNASIGTIYAHRGAQVRAVGSGTLFVKTYGIDRTLSRDWNPITLGTAPGVEYTRLFAMNSEGASTRFSMATANHHAILSAYRHYSVPYATRR